MIDTENNIEVSVEPESQLDLPADTVNSDTHLQPAENDSLSEEDEHHKPVKRKKKRTAKYYAAAFFIKLGAAALVIWLIFTFVAGIFICHTNSAYPSVRDGEFCLVNRLKELKQGASAAYSADKQATGGTTTFDKYLVMESDATVPNTSFNFTIEAADATTDNIGGVLVFDGIAGVKFTSSSSTEDIVVNTDGSATVSFKPTDTTTNDVNAGTKTVSFADSVNNNEKFAMKTITIDFSDVKFPNPGIYCYKLTETAPTSGGITNVSGADYICYVSVEDSSGTLIFKDCYFQSGTEAPEFVDVYDTEDTPKVIGKKNTKKVTGVTNRYTTHNLDFNKVVEGNQGSRDKYFKFTVKLTNPAAGEDGHINVNVNDRYIISSQSSYDAAPEKNAATTYEADVMKAANATSIHTGEGDNPYKYVTYSELAAGKEFYIHSNQNIKILGIPDGLGYEISELQEDYTPAVNIRQNADNTLDNNGVIADAKNKVTDGALTADAEITFTNTKGGVIPTGILNTVAGSLCIAGLGAAGITVGVVMLKKKKSDDDSES